MHELDVERPIQGQVGDVALFAGDSLAPADAPRGLADGAQPVACVEAALATAAQIWL